MSNDNTDGHDPAHGRSWTNVRPVSQADVDRAICLGKEIRAQFYRRCFRAGWTQVKRFVALVLRWLSAALAANGTRRPL